MVPTTTMQTVNMEKPRRYQQKPNKLHYDQSSKLDPTKGQTSSLTITQLPSSLK